METTVKSRIKRKKRFTFPKIRVYSVRKRKNPIELFGIWKDKLFFAEDEFLTSRI